MAEKLASRLESPEARGARHVLADVFEPRSIAVVGASNDPGKAGCQVLKTLLTEGFKGRIFPVNRRQRSILGLASCPSIAEIPGPLDLLVISVPAAGVVPIMEEAEKRGDVKGAVILSAGFSETGDPRLIKAERDISAVARKSGIRVFGPNCIGIMNPSRRLITGFAPGIRLIPGSIGFITQSGAFGGALLMLAGDQPRPLGFAKFGHVGNMCDVTNLDLLDLFGRDPNIGVVAVYMEGVRDGRAFLDLAAQVSALKPVFVLKAGRTDAGASAALSHTGTLAGSDAVYDAALRQSGAVRVATMQGLLEAAKAASMLPSPKGKRVCVLTEAGGPGIICMDEIATEGVLSPAVLSGPTRRRLERILPPMAMICRPEGYVDMTAASMAAEHKDSLSAVLADPNVDSVIVISVPPTFLPAMDVAKGLVTAARGRTKPVVVCLMRGEPVTRARAFLEKEGIPTFDTPEGASRALAALTRATLARGASLREVVRGPDHPLLVRALSEGRHLLEHESLRFLMDNGIPVLPHYLASNRREAQDCADLLGGAVALKIVSSLIFHKTDVGGVRLDLRGRKAVGMAYDNLISEVRRRKAGADIKGVLVLPYADPGPEMILGMSRDPQFGPVVMVGGGGTLVEVFRDVSFRIAPFGLSVASEMIRETRSFRILSGIRGEPRRDIEALSRLTSKLSMISARYREITAIDINPIRVYRKGLAILDVKILLTNG